MTGADMTGAVLPSYEVRDGTGPYVLLVHGLLSSRAQWTPNLEALSKVARPVVLELFGHGRSSAPDDEGAYHPDAYVRAFERVREALGVERWALVGQSLGAALTLRYALTHPERISAHVMTNSNSAFAAGDWAGLVEPGMRALFDAASEHGARALEELPVHPRRARRLPAAVQAELVRDAGRCDPIGVGRTGLGTVLYSALGERLAENRVPSLLVVGTREERFRPHADRAREHMPMLEVLELDSGHAVNLEQPAAFDRAATQFLSRHTRDA